MQIQSVITQKISELFLEVLHGIKRPRVIEPPKSDKTFSVAQPTGSDSISLIKHSTKGEDNDGTNQNIIALKNKLLQQGYIMSEELAEEIAKRILNGIIY